MSYCECGEESSVTVGPDSVPLCLTHYDQWLRTQIRDSIKESKRLIRWRKWKLKIARQRLPE